MISFQEPCRLRATNPDRFISFILEAHKFLNPYNNQFEYVVAKATVVEDSSQTPQQQQQIPPQQIPQPNNTFMSVAPTWPPTEGIGAAPPQQQQQPPQMQTIDYGVVLQEDPWLTGPTVIPPQQQQQQQATMGYGNSAIDDSWTTNWRNPDRNNDFIPQ